MSDFNVNNRNQQNTVQQNAANVQAAGAQQNRNVPEELANARPSNSNAASSGYSIKSFFLAIGRFLGVVRAAPAPQPMVAQAQHADIQPQQQNNGLTREKLADMIRAGNFKNLPDDIKRIDYNLRDELREKFFKDAVKPGKSTLDLISNKAQLADAILNLPEENWKEALPGLIKDMVMPSIIQASVKHIISEFAKEHNLTLEIQDIDRLKKEFNNNPGINNLNGCKDLAALKQLIQGELDSKLSQIGKMSEVNNYEKLSRQWVAEGLAKKSGYDADNLLECFDIKRFYKEASKLSVRLKNMIKGNDAGINIEQEFRKIADEFVNKRMSEVGQVDELDISPKLKNKWKNEILQYGLIKGFNLNYIVEVGKSGIGEFIKHSLDAGKSGQALSNDIEQTLEMMKVGLTNFYGLETMNDFGNEEYAALIEMCSQVVMDSVEGLNEGLCGHKELLELFRAKSFYLGEEFLNAAIKSSNVSFAGDNTIAADLIEKPKNTKLPVDISQGAYNAVKEIRKDFGQEMLPEGMEAVLNMALPGGKTVRQEVAQRVRNCNERITDEILCNIFKEVLIPVTRDKTCNQVVNEMAEKNGIKLSELDKKRILTQLSAINPKLQETTNREGILQVIKSIPNADDIVTVTYMTRELWENYKKEVSSNIAKEFGLTESRVQFFLRDRPDLYEEFFQLPAEKRNSTMNAVDFPKWCEEKLQSRIKEIESALLSIRDAKIPDSVRNTLIDQVLSGKIDSGSVFMIIGAASSAAGSIKTEAFEKLKQIAAQNNKFKSSEIIAALSDFEKQLTGLIPSKGFTDEQRSMVIDLTRQIFMNNHRDFAKLMARMQTRELAMYYEKPEAQGTLALLNVGRGIIADEWLDPKTADKISKGTANVEEQRKLENALRYGSDIFKQISQGVPAHLHSILRYFIGSFDLGDENTRRNVWELAGRMANIMSSWEDFDVNNCPQEIAERIKNFQSKVATDYMNGIERIKDNIHSAMYNDIPRSLYSINGKGLIYAPASEFIAEFKDKLTPGYDKEDLDEKTKTKYAKLQRFVSGLMMQGNWTGILGIVGHIDTDDNFYKQNGNGKIVNRAYDKNFRPLAGGDGSVMQVDVEISEDGKSVVVRHWRTFGLVAGGKDNNSAPIANVRMCQEITVNIEGDEPTISDCRVSQKIISSLRDFR